MVAAANWLHALTPSQAIVLIVAYALLVQGYAVWELRRALNFSRLQPFIIGSAMGIPAGLVVLKCAAPSHLRIAVGVLNGLLGGSTGLGGILPMIWCGLRGWSKEEQRAVF